VRDHRIGHWFEQFIRDLTYAVRVLRKSPAFTAVAVLTLAIGIGATITIFSYINAYLLRPLPFPDGERLTQIQPSTENFGRMSVAYTNFRDWQQLNHTFESIESLRQQRYNLTGTDQPERLIAGEVSANFLSQFGAQPLRGRLFRPEDDHGRAAPTAVISYRLWQRIYGADTSSVEQPLILDGTLHTVIGILPDDFRYPPNNPEPLELWIPLGLNESQPDFLQRWNHSGIKTIGQRKAGVSLEQARTDLNQIANQLALAYPETNTGATLLVDDFKKRLTRHIRPGILTLMAAVGGVLLIVCVNVAGLLLARASKRTHELSIRSALGACRGDLVRQLLSENLILTVVGAATGLLVARLGSDLLFTLINWRRVRPTPESSHSDGIPHGRVFHQRNAVLGAPVRAVSCRPILSRQGSRHLAQWLAIRHNRSRLHPFAQRAGGDSDRHGFGATLRSGTAAAQLSTLSAGRPRL